MIRSLKLFLKHIIEGINAKAEIESGIIASKIMDTFGDKNE